MTGGRRPQVSGSRFESRVKKDLEAHGWWAARLRSGGGEPVDVVALRASGEVWFVQCKVAGYISPGERETFVLEAKTWNAVPVLATKAGRGLDYKVLDVGD